MPLRHCRVIDKKKNSIFFIFLQFSKQFSTVVQVSFTKSTPLSPTSRLMCSLTFVNDEIHVKKSHFINTIIIKTQMFTAWTRDYRLISFAFYSKPKVILSHDIRFAIILIQHIAERT